MKGKIKITKGIIKLRNKFNQHLSMIEIARSIRRDFLASLKPPLHILGEKVPRWHPVFALHGFYPRMPLPIPPFTYMTAKNVLNVAQDPTVNVCDGQTEI